MCTAAVQLACMLLCVQRSHSGWLLLVHRTVFLVCTLAVWKGTTEVGCGLTACGGTQGDYLVSHAVKQSILDSPLGLDHMHSLCRACTNHFQLTSAYG